MGVGDVDWVVALVRELGTAIVAVVGALAAYRVGHRRGRETNGHTICDQCGAEKREVSGDA